MLFAFDHPGSERGVAFDTNRYATDIENHVMQRSSEEESNYEA